MGGLAGGQTVDWVDVEAKRDGEVDQPRARSGRGGEEQSVEEKGERPFDVWGEIWNKCSRKSCPKTFNYKQVQTRK